MLVVRQLVLYDVCLIVDAQRKMAVGTMTEVAVVLILEKETPDLTTVRTAESEEERW